MLHPVLSLYKPPSLTPLESIRLWQLQHPEYEKAKIGYAGRLDPMAEGVLLCLVNDENHNRKAYELLPKEYDFTLLLGLTTDTYDLLGYLTSTTLRAVPAQLQQELETMLPTLVGKRRQVYPPYSSPCVAGKPLFAWARAGELDKITLPFKEIEVYSLQLQSIYTHPITELTETIVKRISQVKGNFRQKEITARWKTFFSSTAQEYFLLASFHLTCSSGTYVRSVGQQLGELLGCGAVVFTLKRTSVGPYTIQESQKLTLL